MSYIKGNFRKYIFKSDKGYVVGLFKIRDTSDDISFFKNKTITFTGYFHDLNESDFYIFNGAFTEHERYGEQFSVSSYEVVLPDNKDNIVSFLSSDLFKGIGEAKAIKIVDVLGTDALSVIIDNPDSLLLVPTITIKQKDLIYKSLMKYQNSYSIIVELTKIGFNTKDALLIFNTYKEETMELINTNVYSLIDNLYDINYKKIEQVRSNLGILDKDERRIGACIKYVMGELNYSFGNTYCLKQEILAYVRKVLFINDDLLISNCLEDLIEKEEIILENEKYFLKDMYKAEEFIAKRIFNLANNPSKVTVKEKEFKDLEEYFDIEFNPDQLKAIKKSIKNNFLVITGGPGTGKTTIIRAIAKLYQEINGYSYEDLVENLALLAPTGRASKRISEQTLLPASTIHRFLKWNKEDNTFGINEENKSLARMFIIDEASMIDTSLFYNLLLGIRENAKIVLVGDYNQLPSVGPGQVLKDIIESECVDVIKLNKLYRQKENSNIITFAHNINNHIIDDSLFNVEEDLTFVLANNNNIKDKMLEYIETYKNLNFNKFQVLVPIYKGDNGIDDLNDFMQGVINPKSNKKNEIIANGILFRKDDKVLQLVNMVDQNVFNGDIGKVINTSNTNPKEIFVDFDNNIIRYTPVIFSNIRLGYAISIHKSQGSEFDVVIIPILNKYSNMLYNKLIYTAVTRTKKKLILIGELDALEKSILNDKDSGRRTNLKNFMTSCITLK